MTDTAPYPAGSGTDSSDSLYNPVFEKLVDQTDDERQLIGLVAYGLYKQSKRDWLVTFRKEKNRDPTEDEYHDHARSQTDTTLRGYVSQASELFSIYSNSIIETERPKIEAAALKGSFMSAFWPSFWSSIAFTLLLVVLGLFLYWVGVPIPIQIGK
ncbi:MAG: hypothetical protein K5821_14255 [Nitrobacter sp.]|uniref:hypothetical protein n=1 Tax=Nitrobacter sp. TaxID=29420 RepID=UPI00261F7262|nr:hypothetical protein [Nitrobacter sp.]MCV0387560.1 hypothetical protein [Nitrobacter sp.]